MENLEDNCQLMQQENDATAPRSRATSPIINMHQPESITATSPTNAATAAVTITQTQEENESINRSPIIDTNTDSSGALAIAAVNHDSQEDERDQSLGENSEQCNPDHAAQAVNITQNLEEETLATLLSNQKHISKEEMEHWKRDIDDYVSHYYETLGTNTVLLSNDVYDTI